MYKCPAGGWSTHELVNIFYGVERLEMDAHTQALMRTLAHACVKAVKALRFNIGGKASPSRVFRPELSGSLTP